MNSKLRRNLQWRSRGLIHISHWHGLGGSVKLEIIIAEDPVNKRTRYLPNISKKQEWRLTGAWRHISWQINPVSRINKKFIQVNKHHQVRYEDRLSRRSLSASSACQPHEYYCSEESCMSLFVVPSAIERYTCTNMLNLSNLRTIKIKYTIL